MHLPTARQIWIGGRKVLQKYEHWVILYNLWIPTTVNTYFFLFTSDGCQFEILELTSQ